MAVNTSTNVGRRRFVYGVNVAIQVVVVALVVVGLVALAQRYKGQADLTRSGVNSLNNRTVKMLKNLPANVRITALYPEVDESIDKFSKKRHDTVRDLLALYDSAGRGKVAVSTIDPLKQRTQLPALLQRLREKPAYKDQAQEHVELLEQFPALNTKIATLLATQIGELEQAPGPEAGGTNVARELTQEMKRLQQRGTDVLTAIGEMDKNPTDLPRYSQAIEEVRRYFDVVSSYLQAVADFAKNRAAVEKGVSPEMLQRIQSMSAQYEPLIAELKAYTDRTQNLKPVELEEIANQLNRAVSAPPLLVETDEKAAIVSNSEVWPFRKQPVAAPDGDEREFAGEQALSSAILKLTQKEKTAVVFVRWGGPSPITPDFSQMNMMNLRQMPRAPFGTLNELLGKENFITQDWDVSTSKTPPVVEDAARTVYVVFPPTPPEQPDPRNPVPPKGITPEDVQIVTDAIDKSGMGIFLVGWRPPESGPMPGMPGGDSKYEYADYLASTWGVEPRFKYLVLPFVQSPENPKLHIPTPQVRSGLLVVETGEHLQFTDHPVAAPLQTEQAGLDVACPLVPAAQPPAGVKVEPLANVKRTPDVWALADVMRLNQDFRQQRGTYRREEDLAPPFALALAVERTGAATTAPAEGAAAIGPQRLVVFGSSTFVNNTVLDMPGGIMLTGGGLASYPAYPGNSDLFINAVHWVTRDADRIAVGAQAADLPRLTKLKDDATLKFWRVFLVGIWPGLALVVGGGVWLLRRR